ncbi:MAG: FKBP-type peptidyl-prolyl cis-trans isomerase [Mycolicibacterium fortuitum]
MRLRPLALLSTVAAATLILTGCTGSPDAEKTPEPTSSAESGNCLVDAKPGAGSDAVQVEGSGLDAKITVPAGTKMENIERTVLKKGEGKDVAAGDLISIRYQIVDASTNKVLETSERGPDGALPVLLDPANAQQQEIFDSTQSPIFIAAAECMPLGSEAVLVLPGAGDQSPVVIYLQTIAGLPTTATGSDVEPPAGMATVKLDKDGVPTITVPQTDPPAETTIGLLKKGDGATVGAGDLVTVQYLGVTWADGKEFDSSWSRGAAPTQFLTSRVVPGFTKALEGQQVGSQVLVEIPPADGYGDKDNGAIPANSTLVFVIDILATTPLMTAG